MSVSKNYGEIMRSEIAQTPEVFQNLSNKISDYQSLINQLNLSSIQSVILVARGTSDNAALFLKYLIETKVGIPCGLASPSVVTIYKSKLKLTNSLVIAVSQSGQSPDIIAYTNAAKAGGAVTLSMTNDPSSPLAKATDLHLYIEAGIEKAGALAAVTNGDNSNILIARVAREEFGIERVVARIYDPKRAAVYQRLGIPTVATVAWTSNQILSIVMPQQSAPTWTSPTSTHFVVERHVQAATPGRAIDEFTTDECRVVLLGRNGVSQIPPTTVLLQEGDVLHVLATTSGIETFDHAFTAHQGSHS